MKIKYAEVAGATLLLLISLLHLQTVAFIATITPDRGFAIHHLAYDPFFHAVLPRLLHYVLFYGYFLWSATGWPAGFAETKRPGAAILSLLLPALAVLAGEWFAAMLEEPYVDEPLLMGFINGGGRALMITLFGALYLGSKIAVRRALSNDKKYTAGRRRFLNDLVVFVVLWNLVNFAGFLLTSGGDQRWWLVSMAFVPPSAFAVYSINVYWLLPLRENGASRTRFWLLELFGSMLACCLLLPYGLIAASGTVARITGMLAFWVALVSVFFPLAYLVYGARRKRQREIDVLQTDLDASAASLGFLKSQINPHFLFNALNTLYGTALAEKADRSAEGIQKLGDMMRFMLHDNLKDKTTLAAEIAYLENYVSLQRLRIVNSNDITIDIRLPAVDHTLMISPMLLIPFVENAFKHGISLRDPSWIHVDLHLENHDLRFTIRNSIHATSADDPERGKSGVGLENVKQRLLLIYPGRHQLTVSTDGREFQVQLTLQLV